MILNFWQKKENELALSDKPNDKNSTRMKQFSLLVILLITLSCSNNNMQEDIKGIWGLSKMKMNEEFAQTKMNKDELIASRYLLEENFKNLLKENYKIIVINDSISFYHRKMGVENSNYKDPESYVFDHAGSYTLEKKDKKTYLTINSGYDTTTLEIFSFSKDKLELESIYSDKLGISEFKRLE